MLSVLFCKKGPLRIAAMSGRYKVAELGDPESTVAGSVSMRFVVVGSLALLLCVLR